MTEAAARTTRTRWGGRGTWAGDGPWFRFDGFGGWGDRMPGYECVCAPGETNTTYVSAAFCGKPHYATHSCLGGQRAAERPAMSPGDLESIEADVCARERVWPRAEPLLFRFRDVTIDAALCASLRRVAHRLSVPLVLLCVECSFTIDSFSALVELCRFTAGQTPGDVIGGRLGDAACDPRGGRGDTNRVDGCGAGTAAARRRGHVSF